MGHLGFIPLELTQYSISVGADEGSYWMPCGTERSSDVCREGCASGDMDFADGKGFGCAAVRPHGTQAEPGFQIIAVEKFAVRH